MRGAEAQTKKVEAAVKGVHDRLESLSDLSGKVGAGLTAGITAPLLAVGAAAVKTTVEMDSLKRGLTAVTGSSAEAERQLVRLKKIAELPGLGFKEAVQGSIRLQSAGYSAKQAEAALLQFSNAIAVVGGGKEQLDGVTLALSQIASKGKVSAEEINQLAERMPQVRKAMEAAFGTSNTEILQSANITANEFLDAMTQVLARDQRVGDTLKNQFENAQQKISDSLDRIGRAITPKVAAALDSVATAVERLTKAFDALPKHEQDLVVNLGIAALIAGPVISGLTKVAELVASIRGLAAGVAIPGGAALAGGVAGMAGLIAAPAILTVQQDRARADAAYAKGPKAARAYIEGRLTELQSKRLTEGMALSNRVQSDGDRPAGSSMAMRSGQLSHLDGEIAALQKELSRLSALGNGNGDDREIERLRGRQNREVRASGPIINAAARAKAAKGATDAAKRAKAEAMRIAEANQRVREDIERLEAATVSGFAELRVGNAQEYEQLIKDGVDPALALKYLALKNRGVGLDESAAGGRRLDAAMENKARLDAQVQKGLEERRKAREALERGLMDAERRGGRDMALMPSPGIKAVREAAPLVGRQIGSPTGDAAYDPLLAIRLRRAQGLAADVARTGGAIARAGFDDLVAGRDVIGSALKRVQSSALAGIGDELGHAVAGIGDELGHAVEKGLRKRLTSVFEDAVTKGVGEKLGRALEGSLKGINASAGAILTGAYSLIAALSRRKSIGVGSVLGAVGGFLTGGPMGALQGYNIGNALDNGDWGGAIAGGISAAVANNTPTTTGSTSGGRSRAVVIVNHYGNQYGIEDVEAASLRQGRAIERALAFG